MAMFGGRSLYGSVRAAIDPYCKTRSFKSYASCFRSQRLCSYGLPTASGSCTSSKSKEACGPSWYLDKGNSRTLPLSSFVGIQQLQADSSTKYSKRSLNSSQSVRNILNSRCDPLCFSASSVFVHRAYSSQSGGKRDDHWNATAETSSNNNTDAAGSEWVDTLNHARQSAVDAATSIGNKAKELSDEISPYIQQFYDSHPCLENVIVPVGGTVSATVAAWFILPRILRKIHKYAAQSPFASLSWSSKKESVSYEKSLWSALEDPARYLTAFMAFSQLGVMIAPTTSQYLPQAWRGAVVLSFVWFLHRWKTNFFSNAMANQVNVGLDRDKLMALEKVSSVGLLILAVMALAEACGVAVQSILTVGGIGGVATAFAARDILGNVLSGLSVQFSKPFSVGDNIKAGSVEGQVVEMGLTTTSLINPEKFPVIVPNSLFSSQVIINKSRAQWRAILSKIPLHIDDLEKIPLVSEEIKSMLRSNPNVFLGKDAPYCYLSRIENSFAELTIGCNLKNMRKDELYAAEQDILLQAAKIIKQHGAELGSTEYNCTTR
ncbi:mechanosensitive ion channel protein 1, mitochondrial-like [Asparagus officinalis]|uniref:mechanosensitive ion channel protein 1, mitochondrial-like n=1 Tax=Asparagus officinalis TaxID=4686 RepID=UPI00098E331E|nr:mechanosensitive ion channel protein 1, mitochondrial-like [Asparagus officinalis]